VSEKIAGGYLEQIKELAGVFAKRALERDQKGEFPHEEVQELRRAGLLGAPVPKRYGGMGVPQEEIILAIKILASANSSVAQVYFVHCVDLEVILELGSDAQKEWVTREIVRDGMYVGQAASERGSSAYGIFDTVFNPVPGGIRIRGVKFFGTGSGAAKLFLVIGKHEGNLSHALVERDAEGLVVHDDWRAAGQRGTASGTIEFKDVFVSADRILPATFVGERSLLGPYFQAGFAAIYVGIGAGALREGTAYVKQHTRPYLQGGAERAIEDKYILRNVGLLQSYQSAADALMDRAAHAVQRAFDAREGAEQAIFSRLRGEASVAVAEAKVVASEVSLRVSQDIMQSCGARSVLHEYDLDRFWRDARTLTLHDPFDYKALLVGEYVLQGKFPTPGFRM
jgi:alkylation response protein AidB-like acyl-CoA dehydrogenase